MAEALRIGGLPVVTLRAERRPDAPGIVEATVLPGRGFMLLQAVAELPGGDRLELLEAPHVSEAMTLLDGGPDDFAGSRARAFQRARDRGDDRRPGRAAAPQLGRQGAWG